MKKNNKGFSLVELLAVIVILGLIAAIGISATSYLVDRAKKDKMDSQKNTVTMSAQTYMQNNKNLVPKIIGESKIIKVSDLRRSNYLTEDIKNNKGESCMEKSYVKVYKLSNSEYTYTTYLYCGSEEIPVEQDVPTPKVVAKFSDSSGELENDKLNNVSDAYLYIEMNAATDSEIQDYKNQGTDIAIDGYSFTIFVTKDGQKKEAYNSGSLSGGREEKILINKKLKDYIDVTGVTQVSLQVTAINTLGGITNTSTTVGEDGEKETTDYHDTVPPQCVKPASPYTEEDWLNKNEYNTTKLQRKLTVGCDDGLGSGCIRNYFTMSWPNDDDPKGAEFVYIEVKDNAGNVSLHNDDCMFRVNVDIQTPEATVTAYVGQASSSSTTEALSTKTSGSNILKKTVKVNDSTTSTKIEPTDDFYKNLVGHNTSDKWMNNANYPNGVIYKIDLKDNIRLDKWKWETNAGYIDSVKAGSYLKVSSSNPEASSGEFPQDEDHGMDIFHGSTHDTIYVRFLTEGMRYGVFTGYDKAGNKIVINIAAHLDRTAPPVPNSLNAYVFNKVRTEGTSVSSTAYGFSTWTNRYVRVQTAAGQNRDNLSNSVTLSGFWQFYYDARNNGNQSVGTPNYNTNSSGIGIYDFKGTASQVDGKNKIRFKGCDKANNCSEYGTDRQVWIDITVPQCSVSRTLHGSESSYGWLGIGESATVTATCSDPTSTLASGCTSPSFSHLYDVQINTSSAGAAGNNKGGSFTDHAGNSVTCPANQRIQTDYQKPSCSVSGGSSAWTNKSRTVTGKCSDTGGSGCVGNISHTYNYNINSSSGGAAGNGNGGSVRDKADNVIGCAANQTVKVDVVMPYVTVSPSPGVYNIDKPGKIHVTATCHDDFSGLSSTYDKSFSVSYMSPITPFGIAKCCEDVAGNTMCDRKGEFSAKTYGRHPDCGVELYYRCRTKACGVEKYKSCATSGCGSYCKSCTVYPCFGGFNVRTCREVEGQNWVAGKGCCAKSGITKKSCSECGSGYYTCENSACGVDYYYYCRNSACGIERYKECWHYGLDQDIATH